MISPFPAPVVRLHGSEPFEGPLDVLLDLVDQDPDRILTIPLAELTAQYLAWLSAAQRQSLPSKSEFVVIAAQLIHLKARRFLSTLATEQAANENPFLRCAGKDPEQELRDLAEQMRQRQEHLASERSRFRNLAEVFRNNALVWDACLPRGADITPAERSRLCLSDLLVHIREVRRQYSEPIWQHVVEADVVTEADFFKWVQARLEESRCFEFLNLMHRLSSRSEQCYALLALLQGAKLGRWSVEQDEALGPVWVSTV